MPDLSVSPKSHRENKTPSAQNTYAANKAANKTIYCHFDVASFSRPRKKVPCFLCCSVKRFLGKRSHRILLHLGVGKRCFSKNNKRALREKNLESTSRSSHQKWRKDGICLGKLAWAAFLQKSRAIEASEQVQKRRETLIWQKNPFEKKNPTVTFIAVLINCSKPPPSPLRVWQITNILNNRHFFSKHLQRNGPPPHITRPLQRKKVFCCCWVTLRKEVFRLQQHLS